MEGVFIVNGEMSVYKADISEKEIHSREVKWNNPIIKDDSILCASVENKEVSFKMIDHGGFEYKLVLLKRLQEILWGDSNINYNDITKEERELVWRDVQSSFREKFKLKIQPITQTIKISKIIKNGDVTYNLDNKIDVIYLLQAIQNSCKKYVNGNRMFRVVNHKDFINNYKDCGVINL